MMEEQIENKEVAVEEAAVQVSPGALLREARERLGLSVADAAAQTKLAIRQIEALEADDYQQLPEMAFVRGFVRSYARILHLDEQPLLAALPEARVSAHVSPTSVEVPFPDARSPQMQNLIWLGAALFLAVVVVAFAVWHITSPSVPDAPEKTVVSNTAQVETAIALPTQSQVIPASEVAETPATPSVVQPEAPATPVAAEKPTQATKPVAVEPVKTPVVQPAKPAASAVPPVPAVKPTVPPAPKTTSVEAKQAIPPATKQVTPPAVSAPMKPALPAATSSASLSLSFGDESWTEVRDKNGNVVSSQLNPAGSELVLKGSGPYSLVVGRASSARLIYKGKVVDMKPYTNATSDVARLSLE